MDIEIENMRRLQVFRVVPRPDDTNIITPRWVFRRKFENGLLVKHKARLVARGFTQVSRVDYNEAHLYAPVMRLESFRVITSIAALYDLSLRQFDVSAAYLHGDIDGRSIWSHPRIRRWRLRLEATERPLRSEAGWEDLARSAQGRHGGNGIYVVLSGSCRVPHWHLEEGRLGGVRILG